MIEKYRPIIGEGCLPEDLFPREQTIVNPHFEAAFTLKEAYPEAEAALLSAGYLSPKRTKTLDSYLCAPGLAQEAWSLRLRAEVNGSGTCHSLIAAKQSTDLLNLQGIKFREEAVFVRLLDLPFFQDLFAQFKLRGSVVKIKTDFVLLPRQSSLSYRGGFETNGNWAGCSVEQADLFTASGKPIRKETVLEVEGAGGEGLALATQTAAFIKTIFPDCQPKMARRSTCL